MSALNAVVFFVSGYLRFRTLVAPIAFSPLWFDSANRLTVLRAVMRLFGTPFAYRAIT